MLRQLTGPLISLAFFLPLLFSFGFLFSLVLSTHRSAAIIQVFLSVGGTPFA